MSPTSWGAGLLQRLGRLLPPAWKNRLAESAAPADTRGGPGGSETPPIPRGPIEATEDFTPAQPEIRRESTQSPAAATSDETLPPSPPPGEPTPRGLPDPKTEETLAPTATVSLPLGMKIRQFGDYELLSELGRGGMGVVYKARHTRLNRIVALKMVLAGQLADETEIKRFLAEAEAAAQLDHPGIVPIHEIGQLDGQHYFSMGFVEGPSLAGRLAQGPLSPREAAELVKAVAEAVHYAHQKGVVHRDLKPANILLGAGGNGSQSSAGRSAKDRPSPNAAAAAPALVPRITDFGLAKRITGDSGLTATGQVLGTPSYMPPEQAAGKIGQIGPAADVYALGAVLYALLVGRPPFQAANPLDTVLQVLTKEPVSPRNLDAGIPRDLETIALKCLEKDRARRYQTAQELADELARYLAGEPILARPVSPPERAWRWCKRNRTVASLIAGVVTVLVAGIAVSSALAAIALSERHRADVKTEEAGEEAARAERLRIERSAREDAARFYQLADEARYYSGGIDAANERVRSSDFQRADEAAAKAAAVLEKWGPQIEQFPLPDQQPPLKAALYDLQVLRVQTLWFHQPHRAKDALALLHRAAVLGEPSRSYYRLEADLLDLVGDKAQAGAARAKAEQPTAKDTSLDHFVLGERYRMQAVATAEDAAGVAVDQINRPLLEKAVAEYRAAVQKQPDHYWSYFQLGRCHLGLGQGVAAIEALSTCAGLRPDAPWGYSSRGLALALAGKFDAALRDLDLVAAQHPQFLPARLHRGVVFWAQKKPAAALAEFSALVPQSPGGTGLVEAALYRGQIYLEQGRTSDALDDFNRVVAEKPAMSWAWLLRAKAHFILGKVAEGLRDVTELARLGAKTPLAPGSPEMLARRGKTLRRIGQDLSGPARSRVLQLACDQLKKANDAGVRTASLMDDLGAVLELRGDAAGAIAAYSEGLKLDPRHVKLRIKRGWAWANQPRDSADRKLDQQARDDFAEAVRLEPNNAEARCGLGYTLACLKSPAPARLHCIEALLHGSGDYLILHNAACVYAQLSRAGDAQSQEHQDYAMALLARAVQLDARERPLLAAEPAFKPLRARKDFQQLARSP